MDMHTIPGPRAATGFPQQLARRLVQAGLLLALAAPLGCGGSAEEAQALSEEEQATEDALTSFDWCVTAGECRYCHEWVLDRYWYHCNDGSRGWFPE